MLKEIIQIDSLGWPFEGEPQFHITYGTSSLAVKADPFPCYPHDVELVRKIAERVERIFPVGREISIFLPNFDTVGRTNGFTQRGWEWTEKEPRPWQASIVLCGKRIPIHPAMTRYLVAHEYGHAVEYWIEELRGYEADRDEILTEYQKVRGVSNARAYGGGKWHTNIGEVLANDFRILVCEVEEEFWPHPDFERPEKMPAVRAWWDEAWKLTLAKAAERKIESAAA